MGSSISSPAADSYVIWTRQKEDNKYHEAMALDHFEPDDENTLRDAMGMFQREVYMFALGRKYVDAQVLYLYNGYSRLARAEMKDGGDVLHLTFPNTKMVRRWGEAPEMLAPQQWPLFGSGRGGYRWQQQLQPRTFPRPALRVAEPQS